MIRPKSVPTPVRDRLELEIAGGIIIILIGIYAAYARLATPSGSQPFGHWLGIIGTALMIMTELLYSVRKRTRLFNRWGAVRHWLSFHVVTGLVGPFLVLMHTGLHFRGLAGFTMWLTVLMVVSGFIGRYLYARLRQQPEAQRWFKIWHTLHIPLGLTLFASVAVHTVATIYFAAGVLE
jgi:hypothetical protein